MDWARGYVADIGYTASFYAELTPSRMAFAALVAGRSPGLAWRPKRMIELGFGQGFGLALLAAANPDIAFEGCDFNPEHMAHVQGLIQRAGLPNLAVTEASFEDLAARGGSGDADVIGSHGVLSWVSRESQDAIVTVARQRLKPNGMFYASYNCVPGCATEIPIRQFLLEVKRRNPGRSSERQLAVARDLLTRLKAGNALYFTSNPSAGQSLERMQRYDTAYLVHEYLHEHWDLFQFADIVTRFGEAKLSYIASAALAENFEVYTTPNDLIPQLAAIDDPVLRETARDIASNKRFRRDLFARGSAAVTPAESRRMLSEMRFALGVGRGSATLKFPIAIGEVNGIPDLYTPMLDLLADKIVSFDELVALPAFGEQRLGLLLQCLCLLVDSGQAFPITSPPADDHEPAQRFNRVLVENAKAGRFYGALASPVVRSGIRVNELGLLALDALFEGKADDPTVAAQHVFAALKKIDRRPTRDGRTIEDDADAVQVLEESCRAILESFPTWRRLGII